MIRRYAIAVGLVARLAFCQQTGLRSFDAAVVKPGSHPVTKEGYGYSDVSVVDARRFRAVNADLTELIEWAYEVRADRISGPDDIKSKTLTFDIDATVPEGADKPLARLMLRRLLTERFALVLHSVTKPTSGYSLVVDRGGPKLKPSDQTNARDVTAHGGSTSVRLVSPAVRMGTLAGSISRNIDAPVVDQTNLAGIYDVDIQFSRIGPVESDAPTVFDALKRLGLRLEKAEIPVESLVVDQVNFKPTEN